MLTFLDHLASEAAIKWPERTAFVHKKTELSFEEFNQNVDTMARKFADLGLQKGDRVAIFLPKQHETVTAVFAASRANGVFVPVNSVLKAPQVKHILNDCDVNVLVTSSDRLKAIGEELKACPALKHIVLVDKLPKTPYEEKDTHLASDIQKSPIEPVYRVDNDVAAILYTSGSTGKPKGVVLSHRNLLAGAESVADYLNNTSDDVILALLPLSFDYGLSQITTSLLVGAKCILMDYFLAGDVVKTMATHKVTGLAAVPPLYQQLMKANWNEEATQAVRYFTNSGGAMPLVLLKNLRDTFSHASPFLMYGLTEAFRSTYLDPKDIDRKPGSMGKAIPNAQIMVINEQGQECEAGEIGELVHRGPHVSLGYWNDEAKTAERFKPVPVKQEGLVLTEMAVWSGDQVKRDEEGFLFFVGRNDEMIKTSGYRVSPMEVEEACYQGAEEVAEAVACGVNDNELGQAIVVLLVLKEGIDFDEKVMLAKIKKALPNFMHPKYLEIRSDLPRNPNGKVDRSNLAKEVRNKYAHG
ncbi:acyl-CoA ligase (AMP-forming), exosortase A system-associated [Aestuariibacter sp. AA17]|uniref:Acyl-CoA ligase (AMP-forming), exosortase A system-associated n=1 Tax=Fluctibacter corallii TaxID=2984329 RepID=A0ABT3ABI5_9ALTE|nr:acyl-CoA ligase (AMP-forming), exosortase A system-associated [Aestuariibacter sp. AA17]MCV2886023.1 acyl-CoA ligase (AMP-forming), exosortase A system-associated [Aestuariibacter sp. AA17]